MAGGPAAIPRRAALGLAGESAKATIAMAVPFREGFPPSLSLEHAMTRAASAPA
jgi:hypothetical protein